jgi:arylsulfatase A-like enzyme
MARATLGVMLSCAVATPFTLDAAQPVTRLVAASNLTRVPLSWLRATTDLDGDGAATTYGGGDCAPFDAKISPRALDVVGNGIDEDCSGADATLEATREVRTFSKTLTPDRIEKYNVVWIVADALRVDHMSVYGARRKTTPYLERFATEAVVFDRAYVQAVTTHVSLPSMFVGKDARNIQWAYGNDETRVQLGKGERTLADRLRVKGYRTGAVAVDYVQGLAEVLRGFEHRYEYTEREGAPRTNQLALRFLAPHLGEAPSKQPFFLLVYYVDTHQPYFQRNLGEPVFGKWKPDRYDSQIALVDRYAGMLLDQLGGNPQLNENTIVIFGSDHGEEFRERGKSGHGSHCHEEVMHVPLLVRIPGVQPQRSDALVALTDVVPTILELTGNDQPTDDLDGQSLLMPLTHPSATSPDRGVTCVALKQGGVTEPGYYREALRTRDRLLLNHRMAQRVELFDTSSDPAETHDRASDASYRDALPDIQRRLRESESGNLWQLRLP